MNIIISNKIVNNELITFINSLDRVKPKYKIENNNRQHCHFNRHILILITQMLIYGID
jgi:hypothetical protein